MEIFAGLSVLVLLLIALFVTIKTYALWFRTRGLPELLLALYLTCATVLGYPLAIAMGQIPAAENRALHVATQVIMAFGWTCLLLFTLNVFRKGVVWAWCVVGASMSLILAGGGAYIAEVLGENPRPPAEMIELVAFNSIPSAIAYLWTTWEAFGYHLRLKLRLQLNLADPVVVNRMLLWGIMTLSAGVAVVISMVAMLFGHYLSPAVVVGCSAMGLIHAGSLFLAFHPPGWYRRWLEQGAPAAGA